MTYQICKKCIMDTSDPEIQFDEAGICNYCRTYEGRKKLFVPEPSERKLYLKRMVEYCRERGRGRRYDCVIGVSGGVDSTYVAYKVKELGLRPLAVHLDNGWDSELAVSNIMNVLDRLDIELYTHVLDWEMFRSLQVAFLKASTPDSEIPSDHAIVALMRSIASKEKVPVIWGVNFASESILPRAWSQGHMDWGYIKNVNNLFGGQKLKGYPHYSVFKLSYWNRIQRQRLFNILNYMDYDKEVAKQVLKRELGWRDYGGKHHESIYTKFFQGYILPQKFGFDKRRAHYSSLILAGQVTRDEALQGIQQPLYDKDELQGHLNYVCKKLGLTPEEFHAILSIPPRRYEELSPRWPRLLGRVEKTVFGFLRVAKRKIVGVGSPKYV